LPASYVLVVTADSLLVHELIGVHMTSPTQGHRNNLHKMRALNVMSNPLEWLLVLHRGIGPRTPHNHTGSGHKQLPTRANLLKLLQAI
jgi:hypothetical protein